MVSGIFNHILFTGFCNFERTMKMSLRQVKIKYLKCGRAGHDRLWHGWASLLSLNVDVDSPPPPPLTAVAGQP